MDKEKKSYYFNVIEAKDGKMNEVMNFNFGGHHDLAANGGKCKGIRHLCKRQARQGICDWYAPPPPCSQEKRRLTSLC